MQLSIQKEINGEKYIEIKLKEDKEKHKVKNIGI